MEKKAANRIDYKEYVEGADRRKLAMWGRIQQGVVASAGIAGIYIGTKVLTRKYLNARDAVKLTNSFNRAAAEIYGYNTINKKGFGISS